jgi:phosphohistidine phosphatase
MTDFMDLFILRHGEAGTRLSSNINDGLRSLTDAGRKEVLGIAKGLQKIGVKFDIIASSPLKRAHETATLVASVFKMSDKLLTWNELAPEGKRAEVYQKIAGFRQESSVMLVGHEPFLSEMINEIISKGKPNSANIVLKKAGLAKIRILTLTPVPKGELRWLLTPKFSKSI